MFTGATAFKIKEHSPFLNVKTKKRKVDTSTANLSSEDKWNPADIWMAKKSEIASIKKHLDGENTIDCLNNALLQRFNDGSLIGISLKKIEGNAKMDAKNNQPASVRKANENPPRKISFLW